MINQKAIVSLIVLLTFPAFIIAQTSYGGTPFGLQKSFQSLTKQVKVEQRSFEALDLVALQKEDQIKGNYNRFAVGENTGISLDNSGTWTELNNGDRLWRIEIIAENALGLSFLFDNFRIPETAKLFVYNPQGESIKGAYNHLNNKSNGKFMAGIVSGSKAIVEYFEPKKVAGMGFFEIYKVFKVYQPTKNATEKSSVNSNLGSSGFGDASGCHSNINCPEADEWQELKKGVARITMVFENAMGFCTGTLMNNIREDGTPYILTAFHCAEGALNPLYEHWQFDFNYEAIGCENPETEPIGQSIQGCLRRSGQEESDFLLVEIDQTLPADFDVRFHGWDRSDNVPDTAAMIHHPQGDIMKFSVANDDISIFPNPINWNTNVQTPGNYHFQTILDLGAFETGSSGCAFLDNHGRVVGQLNGGNVECEGSNTFIGRLFQSWSNSTVNNSLQPFLDPENTGAMQLDGMNADTPESVSIAGKITSVKNVAMSNVEVNLTGDVTMTTTTDVDGMYSFEDLLMNGSYTIAPNKNTNHFSGISTGDMLPLRRDILGIAELNDVAKYIAGDATNNQNISTADMLALQRMILGITQEFPSNSSWRFYTTDYPSGLTGPNPFEEMSTTGALDAITINGITQSKLDLDFVGIKIGDVNQSGNPNE